MSYKRFLIIKEILNTANIDLKSEKALRVAKNLNKLK
jgi:hypothetical protein